MALVFQSPVVIWDGSGIYEYNLFFEKVKRDATYIFVSLLELEKTKRWQYSAKSRLDFEMGLVIGNQKSQWVNKTSVAS